MTRERSASAGRRLQVAVTDASGRLPDRSAAGLARWLERHAPRSARGRVAIAIVSDAEMRRLNRTYRGVDAPTDVLSFPASEPADSSDHRSSRIKDLGDIAVARGVAARQARALGHPVSTELRILVVHGLLHLLGYDHERDQGTMRRVEERVRRRAGLPAGLIARVPRVAVNP